MCSVKLFEVLDLYIIIIFYSKKVNEMLGRHHSALTIGTILPFLIPLIFVSNDNALIYGFTFLIAALIGSLTPDADCGGNATLYYRFGPIDWLMKKVVIKLTIKLYEQPYLKKQVQEGYKVQEEHRGIMHAPAGIIISSLILTIIGAIIAYFVELFNITYLMIIFSGLLVGQFFHLLEDSCTVSGINWKFPKGKKELSGNIYTFDKFQDKKDYRPDLFFEILSVLNLAIFLLLGLEKMTLALWQYYLIVCFTILIIWLFFLWLSGIWSESKEIPKIFLIDKEKYKEIKKGLRKSIKQR